MYVLEVGSSKSKHLQWLIVIADLLRLKECQEGMFYYFLNSENIYDILEESQIVLFVFLNILLPDLTVSG